MILGITGGAATGKSTIMGMLPGMAARKGIICQVISADALARDLLDPGTACSRKVIEHFGPDFALSVDEGVVNRSVLAQRIFSDSDERRWLEDLLHPPVILALKEAGAPFKGIPVNSKSGEGILAMEVPLLYEKRLENLVDRVLVTKCSQDIQIDRLVARRAGNTVREALNLISSQLPQEDKAGRADFIVDTGAPLDVVECRLEQILDTIISAGGSYVAS